MTEKCEEYTVKIYTDGTKEWYQNDKRHRLDGPAEEWANGSKFWCQNGKRHRLDGPAIEWANGSKEYWIDGIQYSEDEFNQKVKPVKELTVAEVSKLLGYEIKIVK